MFHFEPWGTEKVQKNTEEEGTKKTTTNNFYSHITLVISELKTVRFFRRCFHKRANHAWAARASKDPEKTMLAEEGPSSHEQKKQGQQNPHV